MMTRHMFAKDVVSLCRLLRISIFAVQLCGRPAASKALDASDRQTDKSL